MTHAFRWALAGAGLALGLLAAGGASAATKSPAMQACSDQWAQLKADDKVPSGQTWPKFWSQCAKDYAAAHPDDAASAADKTAAAPAEPPPAKKAKAPAKEATKEPAKAPAPAKPAAAKPAPAKPVAAKPAEPAAAGKGKSPAMQACSDEWAGLKADGKVPSGQTWPKFWSQCAKDYAAAHPADAASAADKTAAAPVEPPAKKAKAPAKEPVKAAAPAKPAETAAAGKGKSPAMQACSDDWADLKADGKVPAGQTWPKFWSQCAKDYAAAHPADAASAADKTAAAPAEPPPAKKAKATAAKAPAAKEADTAPAGKGGSSAMQACSDAWAKLKADDNVPAGQTWPKFWSQCSKDYAAAHPAEAPAKGAAKAPAKAKPVVADDDEIGGPLPEPEVAAKLDPDKPAVGKREPTPGQKAAWARMRACGAEWQAEKKAGSLPAGAKWPQYWSDCNKRLKAKG